MNFAFYILHLVRTIVNWLLGTSIFTAACSLALCLSAEKLALGYLPPMLTPLHAIIVGSSLLEYNVHRLFNKHVLKGLPRYWYYIFSVIGLVMCLGALPFLSIPFLLWLAVIGFVTIAYSTPLFKKRLKDFGIVKIVVLTAVWVIATTVLPAVYWQRTLTFFWWKIALRAELIFALCVAFDIRDVQHDSGRNIQTLAARLGIANAYLLIDRVLLLFILTGIAQVFLERSIIHLIAIAVTYIAAKAAIGYSRKNSDNNVYLGLIDGVMLLYGLLLLM